MPDARLYIVTGGSGWLGKRLVRALREGHPEMGSAGGGGRRVRCLVPRGETAAELAALGAEIVAGDVREPDAARALAAGAEGGVLVHLAGVIHPQKRVAEFRAVNVEGTRTIVEAAAAAGVARAVVMSSNSPIGVSRNPHERFDEDSPYRPYMGYGRSKREMEELLLARMRGGEAPDITIVRAPWFYGPEQPLRQTRFFSMIRSGRFPLVGDGRNRRSMAYVDSLAYGILLAAEAPVAANRIYWLADERPYPMREIIDTVRTVLSDDFGLSVRERTLRVPGMVGDLARAGDFLLQKFGRYNQELHVLSEMNLTIACAIDRAKRELGYRPLVELREGMRRSVQWCLDRGIEI